MPAPPKIGDGNRLVRRMKVLGKLEAQKQSQPDRHVRITTKIKIDLQGVGQQSAPSPRQARRSMRKGPFRNEGDRIRNQNFFGQPQHKQNNPRARLGPRMAPFPELFVNFMIPDNRARHELREQGHIAGEINETARGSGVAAININRIAHRLKGVEGNPNRQHQMQKRHQRAFGAQPSGNLIDGRGTQIVIFEEAEDR